MFEEECKNMSEEEQEDFNEFREEYLELVAIGNGDYSINSDGEIEID